MIQKEINEVNKSEFLQWLFLCKVTYEVHDVTTRNPNDWYKIVADNAVTQRMPGTSFAGGVNFFLKIIDFPSAVT